MGLLVYHRLKIKIKGVRDKKQYNKNNSKVLRRREYGTNDI